MEKAILFDFDGVIADSLDYVLDIWTHQSKMFGSGVEVTKEFVRSHPTGAWRIFYSEKLGVPLEKLDESSESFRQMQAVQSSVKIFEGMEQVIKELSRTYPLYILSANNSEHIKSGIKQLGLEEYFTDIAGDKEAGGFNKTDPKFLFTILEKWKLKPENVVYVGDTVDEVVGCKLTGVKSISCSWGYQSGELLSKAQPDVLVNQPSELINAINQVLN